MPENLSSEQIAWILARLGITLVRRGKEDVYAGAYQDRNRVVVVPRNKRSIPRGTCEFDLAPGRDYQPDRRGVVMPCMGTHPDENGVSVQLAG